MQQRTKLSCRVSIQFARRISSMRKLTVAGDNDCGEMLVKFHRGADFCRVSCLFSGLVVFRARHNVLWKFISRSAEQAPTAPTKAS
jgi:hypothetical protein